MNNGPLKAALAPLITGGAILVAPLLFALLEPRVERAHVPLLCLCVLVMAVLGVGIMGKPVLLFDKRVALP